ncbi:MAG: hypothetical protein ACR2LT_07795, partial [Pyrinomonadaceae bacterium]
KVRVAMIFINGILIKKFDHTNDSAAISNTSYTKYYYSKTGKIIRTEDWINGKKLRHDNAEMYKYDIDLTAKYLASADFLKQKGIRIPLSGLIFEQIKDTAMILDAGDKYNDFKKEVSSNGEFKTIKFIGFDKKLQLEPTLMIIGSDQPITDYELTLKNGYLCKEVYKIGTGEERKITSEKVIREYFYTGNRLKKLVTTSNLIGKDGKSDKVVSELEFVYSKLR